MTTIIYAVITCIPFNKLQIWYFFINFLINNLNNTIFFFIIFFFINKLHVHTIVFISFLKQYAYVSYLFASELPKGLLLGYNVIHPPLFYLSLIFGISFIFEKLNNIKSINTLIVGLFGILLGGIWGLGNSIWGFFWVDDFIELMFLSYLILLALILHLTFYKNYINYYYVCIFIILTLLITSRWGLIFTRHSFFNILNIHNIFFIYFFTFFFNFLHFFLIFIFFIIFNKYYIYVIIIFLILQLSNITFYNKRWVLIHILFLVNYISWIKLKEYNLLYFFNKFLYNFELLSLTWNITYDSFFLFFFKKYFLSFFKLLTYNVYSVKYFIITLYTGVLSYSFFVYISVISIHKIYVNYLQN